MMNKLATEVFKNQITSILPIDGSAKKPTDAWLANIRWEDYNYPPGLRVVHFDLSELQSPHKEMVRRMYLCFQLIFLISIVNFVNALAQAFTLGDWIAIVYSILNFIIFNTFAFYTFYKGYRGVCAESSSVRTYKFLQYGLFILWIAAAIIDNRGINGLIRADRFLRKGNTVPGVLSIIESLGYVSAAALGVRCALQASAFE
eukprot:TRINITY_DN5252_c0_g3_i1.p1 TRINITY_DN5252_c0_g3~~TRINITY_DN5252_c0_g3_i1.p1  ORF type:complete len:202 (-),score=39.55 TRINITY_DN5252_c0_g3_i1:49-654(-)